ncbi:EndoU domain-containing protein [Nostoc sp. UIC 10607]|uniref:EndoU domain-containing protein n=2 Tax=Nostoc TaxID=1177 RepID=A0ABR8IFG2_9NOSO|nr:MULTISPECIES: EndoU domain-containing protein [Nostoc]MBD2564634.1 EndoU domain-containing protein [Nostoc linckia FACHB-391]MBD2650326.1 EndoU domain-containing protein [Nostoc foliaceum FACHB-393]
MQLNSVIDRLKQRLRVFAVLLVASQFIWQNPGDAQPKQNTQLLPFFDNVNNPVSVRFPPGQQVDITPPPPLLNSFDKAVLKLCGPIGTRVSSNNFKQLLSYYPDVLQKLQQASGGELRPGRRNKAQFLEDLTNIWFKRRGFEHIFCGEIYNADDIGGLHFYGRYLQLQDEGIGGRLPNNQGREEVIPNVIYTMGVVIKQKNRTVTDVIKGYGYLSNAEEMLLDATKIFKLQGNNEEACIYNVRDRETGKSFPTVFVSKEKAIITYYPDATPQGAKCKS